ncbi:MAG: hypothetical protein ABWY56_15715 [Propionibacteriaceae bacterium]
MATPATTSKPFVLFLAAALIGVEALVAITFGVIEVTQIELGRFVVGAGVALLMLSYGAFLIAISRGVQKGRRWSRAPGVATQLLQGLLAYSFSAGETWWVGLILGVSAVAVLVCLLVPPATAVFTAEPLPGEND